MRTQSSTLTRSVEERWPVDFEAVYQRDLPRIYNFFRYQLGDDQLAEDLTAAVKEYGVASVKGRAANFYIQYIGAFKEFYAPVFAPQLLTSRVMSNLDYSFDGPQKRSLTVTVEGPFNLRARPVGGRYNTADHSRRCGYANPSLEFMPTNNSDSQSLFGL